MQGPARPRWRATRNTTSVSWLATSSRLLLLPQRPDLLLQRLLLGQQLAEAAVGRLAAIIVAPVPLQLHDLLRRLAKVLFTLRPLRAVHGDLGVAVHHVIVALQ